MLCCRTLATASRRLLPLPFGARDECTPKHARHRTSAPGPGVIDFLSSNDTVQEEIGRLSRRSSAGASKLARCRLDEKVLIILLVDHIFEAGDSKNFKTKTFREAADHLEKI
ncbi:hypothetical protein B0H19DRAFT_1069150 [Mycena capillaripes]|nr:hypothetical protein B0H19DRAFT_1069150 [Mycena capillaripes]